MHTIKLVFVSFFISFALCCFAPAPFIPPAFADFEHQKPITICTDTNFWYPFSFLKHQHPAGLHIDIISAALHRSGFTPIYKPLPWKECLDQAKAGMVDAVATVSYRDERAIYLNYPVGAAVDAESPFRVTQIGYVIATPVTDATGRSNSYQFTGHFRDIPKPIRVPAHYSVIHDLEKQGLQVKVGKDSVTDFKEMLKEKTGSVIDVKELANYLAHQPEFAGNIKIQSKMLNNKSYYLAFSKLGKINPGEATRIWGSVQNIRENQTLMSEFSKKY